MPVVVRLAGTNAEVAKELLSNSGVSIISADHFEDAAHKVVAALRGHNMAILVDHDSRIIVQGITGAEGSFMRSSALPMATMWWEV